MKNLVSVPDRTRQKKGGSKMTLKGIFKGRVSSQRLYESCGFILALLRELKVDMVVPSLFIGDLEYQSFMHAEEFYKVIDQCISRLKSGGVH